MFGVPQGSIIFLSNLFYVYNNLDYASYADDTTPNACRQNYAEAIEILEPTINNIFAWFKNNELVANSGKSHFFVSSYEKISQKILSSTVEFGPCEELLGSQLTVNLRFINI